MVMFLSKAAWLPFFVATTVVSGLLVAANSGAQADACREALVKFYGNAATDIKTAEGFGISEYGRQPSEDELGELFPMLPPPPA